MTHSARLLSAASFALAGAFFLPSAIAQQDQQSKPTGPWLNASLSPDQRADLLLKKLTLDQKIQLLHGTGDPHVGPPDPHAADSNGGAGYTPGFPEYGIPGIQMADSAYGVALSASNGRYSTALPSNLAAASTWDPEAAEVYGKLIGRELRDQGYTMTLGGGVDITREPRNGRTFEYQGEDPLLAGTMVGHLIRGVQSTHMIGDIKHYAVNDQEDGRHAVSADISERAMRESDLLAFQMGIEIGKPGAVMCSYNRVNGEYACENEFLLKTVLKHDWRYPGFVISDWSATHSTVKASHAGLDNEEPENTFYGPAFKKAVESGQIPMAELDDHAHRILRSIFASGIVDDPPQKQVPDVFNNLKIARTTEQQSIVLLKNRQSILPIDAARVHSIAVIGRNADRGMISGGGSAQVDPPGGNAIGTIPEKKRVANWQKGTWFPDAPLAAIRQAAPGVKVTFNDGTNPAPAAEAARGADVVLFYAYQWESEGIDLPTLALPDGQNAVIEAVAKANAHTIVVLENGSPVLMPWIGSVGGVLETWYSGSAGATAIADVLFGSVNPSAKLPLTFPLSDADLPHPKLIAPPPASREDWSNPDAMTQKLLDGLPPFHTPYDEGLKVGYKWYDAEHKSVLFPFGFGLSYTTYSYSGLHVEKGDTTSVRFTVKNTGARAGSEIAEVYSTMPSSTGEPPKRLIGWTKVHLAPGEQKEVSVEVPHGRFALWDEAKHSWTVSAGEYTIRAGASSQDLPLKQPVELQ